MVLNVGNVSKWVLVATVILAGCTSGSKSSGCAGGSCSSIRTASGTPSPTADPLPSYSGPARVMSLKSVAVVAKANPTVACSIFAGTPAVVSAALFGGKPLRLVAAKSVGPADEVTCGYQLAASTGVDLTVVAQPNTDHAATSSKVLAGTYRAISPSAQVILSSSSGALEMTAPTVKAFANRILPGISA